MSFGEKHQTENLDRFPPQGTFNINNNNYLILYFPQHNYFTNIEK